MLLVSSLRLSALVNKRIQKQDLSKAGQKLAQRSKIKFTLNSTLSRFWEHNISGTLLGYFFKISSKLTY